MGFATVYKFFAYPDRCRLRLSQILVLPPHQGRGVGSLLLRALCQLADAVDAVDVTVSAVLGTPPSSSGGLPASRVGRGGCYSRGRSVYAAPCKEEESCACCCTAAVLLLYHCCGSWPTRAACPCN